MSDCLSTRSVVTDQQLNTTQKGGRVARKVKGTTVRTVDRVPRLKSGDIAKGIDVFLDLVAVGLQDYQRRIARSSGDKLVVREQWPKDPVENPDKGLNLAVFRVISRKPSNTTNEGERRPWRPRQIEQIEHPDDTGLVLTVFSMRYDHEVEFMVASPHAKRANELALLFEDFMMAYSWFLKEAGVQEVHYLERREDKIETINGNELYIRPIRFFVRTEDITQETAKKISEVIIHFDDGPALKTTVLNKLYGIKDHEVHTPTVTGQTKF